MLTIYTYAKCNTCRDALQWLDQHAIQHQVKAIRETPPTSAELKSALKLIGGDLRKLFNSSGQDYRALGLKDRLPGFTETESLNLLSENGNLVKRPFLVGEGIALAGFKPEIWEKVLL